MKQKFLILTAFALLFVGILNVQKGFAAVDKNCPDFASQKEAQMYFLNNGGSKTNNVDDLDRNHNGVACEDSTYTNKETYTGSTLPQGTTGQTGQTNNGGTLPNTASNYPYGIVVGLVIVSLGAILFILPLLIRRKPAQ